MVRVGDEDAIFVWGQLLPVLLLLAKVSWIGYGNPKSSKLIHLHQLLLEININYSRYIFL